MLSNRVDWKNLSFREYCELICDDAAAYRFAVEYGIADLTQICDCGSQMHLVGDASKPTGKVFQCSAGRSVCRRRKSALTASWFANSRLGLRRSLIILASYAADLDYLQTRFFIEIGSESSIADWRSYFRNICAEESLGYSFEQIGGEGTCVEVDESFVFRRKNHVGRILVSERDHVWVLGGICRETRDVFAVTVPDRTASTLEQEIQRHVLPGTRVITDGWTGYSNLGRLGFIHAVVNHSENFVNPDDRMIYTNTIERQWGILKKIIPKQAHGDIRYSYLAEYIWKKRNRWFELTIGERIQCILATLSRISF